MLLTGDFPGLHYFAAVHLQLGLIPYQLIYKLAPVVTLCDGTEYTAVQLQ
jgi:hypothetical protein